MNYKLTILLPMISTFNFNTTYILFLKDLHNHPNQTYHYAVPTYHNIDYNSPNLFRNKDYNYTNLFRNKDYNYTKIYVS